MKTIAIIPSGGVGTRTNTVIPKQYLQFNGKELIAYTLEVFQSSPIIDEIVVSAQPSYFPLLQSIKEKFGITKLLNPVAGGAERQNSVYNALQSLDCNDDDIVLVHDAVRPLLPQNVLTNVIEKTKEFGAAVVAIPAKDTLLKGENTVDNYVSRNNIFYVQTPQCFFYHVLLKAMRKAEEENFVGTDESMLVHRLEYEVKIVNGSSLNFKITTEDDLKIFSSLIDNKAAI